MTCGEIIASRPTSAPPIIGRSAGFTLSRANSNSQAATPRMTTMPNMAASRPRKAAMTMSCTANTDRLPASMPSLAGVKACAVR